MASPSFQMDDQSDEDFFDKLVDDDYQITKPDYQENNQSFQPDSADYAEIETEPTGINNANDALIKLSLDENRADLVAPNLNGKDSGINGCSPAESGVRDAHVEGYSHENVPVDGCSGQYAPPEGSIFGQKELSFSYTSKEELAIRSDTLGSSVTDIKPNDADELGLVLAQTDNINLESTQTEDSKAGKPSSKAGNSSICTNAREVQWSNFNIASTHCDLGGFGSYSDFFSDLPGNSSEQLGESGLDFFLTPHPVENDSGVASHPRLYSTSHHTSQVLENGTPDAPIAAITQPKLEAFSHDMQDQYKHADEQDVYYNQSWENSYPGWKYDSVTGAWHQVEGYETIAGGSSTGEVEKQQCMIGGSDGNLQSTQNTISCSSWQEQSSDDYYGSGTGGSFDHAKSQNAEVTHLQNTYDVGAGLVQGPAEQVASDWHQYSQKVPENQQNFVFDPQYPGWYYDLIAQEWRQEADYGQTSKTGEVSALSTAGSQQTLSHQNYVGSGVSSSAHAYEVPSFYGQNNQFQGFQTQVTGTQWSGSMNDYAISNGQLEESTSQESIYGSGRAYPVEAFNSHLIGKNQNDAINANQSNVYNPSANIQGQLNQSTDFQIPNSTFSHSLADHSFPGHHNEPNLQSSDFSQSVYSYSQLQMDQNQQTESNRNYYGNLQTVDYSHQTYQGGQHVNHTPPVLNSFMEGRSSAGRPPHALVTFGFGGKLVVVKSNDNVNMEFSNGSQDRTMGLITVYNLSQVVMDNGDKGVRGIENGYFNTLCQQAFSNPLVGGSVASKEIFKWIDERIANCEYATTECRNPKLLRMLLCSLKIFCQHYGKLRSSFGVGGASQETDGPEAALTKLFASAKSNGDRLNQIIGSAQCLQTMPSESHFQATALEMKNLLVAGKRKEALQHAQQGQLWGPALVLAWQLGEKFYVDTVTQMAQRQFLPGSPLRTLCLLLAGQPAEVFSTNISTSSAYNSFSGTLNGMQQSGQDCISGMLDDWQENLAIIAANRTKGDERVIVHLGDCLWKERGEVAAAHTCYLVAEANFESFSDSARLCLIGADHWKYPRTYASPEAIQRTELYEYGKVLGNPQYILLPFQPYKLIYANMLAEVGKVSDSLRYCQAVLKTLKNAGRAPEVETCRQLASSLEDRIRIHTQGGYGSNLVPSKLVGRFLTTIDRSIHRIIGAPPPPMASDSQTSLQNSDSDSYSGMSKVANANHRQSAAPLMPSASMEPISEWTSDNSKVTMQTRSVSEPDFSRSPNQEQLNFPSSKAESTPSKARNNAAASGGSSRFGLFGSHIFQKAVGFISKVHHNEAKLGEKNKFYYDEKLKRWVEEGAAPPAEEAALSAPPTSASFVSNGQSPESNYNIGSTPNGPSIHANGGSESRSPSSSENSSGMPPVPPSTNQFSVRGRLHSVRSRYVDTFNKGGGTTPSKSFQSPVIPVARPGGLPSTANFFVPTPAAFDPSLNEAVDMSNENNTGATCASTEDASNMQSVSFPETSGSEEKVPKISGSMHRYSSADNVVHFANRGSGHMENGSVSFSSHSRAASWSGGYPGSIKKSEEPEVLTTPVGNQLSKASHVSGYFSYPTKSVAQRPGSGGYNYASLPSPPPFEPPHSSMTIKKSLLTEKGSTDSLYNQMDHGLGSDIQADNFSDDLQEVEL
eukprot:Gb_04674 [translate_table: standard]